MASSFRSSFTPIAPRRKVLPTVLTFMAGPSSVSQQQSNREEPMTDIYDLLRRAVNEKKRIEVLIRDCRGIDGILIGWLIVFDKHMNLIMSDVDEVCRRLTDGQDYLELGAKHENQPPPISVSKSSLTTSSTTKRPTTDVPKDFQSFREQLANFLKNKKKPEPPTAKPKRRQIQNHHDNDDDDDDDEGGERNRHDENQLPAECHPERFLSMQLLTINNINVQRLSGKTQPIDASSVSSSVVQMSKRPKVRFFSRHIPKMFVKGNQICLIRLLPT